MRRTITIILIVIAVGVLAFFGWRQVRKTQAAANSNYQTVKLSRGDLTASVGATGTVHANQTAIINWQTSGRVASVDAEVGDQVKVNQELAALDEQSLSQSVILARADLVTAKRNLDQLLNSDLARAQAQQALIAAQKALDDAYTKRESKDYARASTNTIDELRANYILAEDNVTKATELYDKVDNRPEDDPVRAEAFSQLAAARKNRDRALANLNYVLGKPDNQEIAEADANVMVAQAKVVDAQREYDRLKNGADPSDIEAAKARIAALELTLGMIQVESPIEGTVTEVSTNPGDQVAPGVTAFRVDDLSRLLVDVQITEVDINRIRVGEPATMSFDAILDKEYSGKVVEVARVGEAAQGVVNFQVTIELNNQDGAVRPGMTAAVNIITDLAENVLLVPNRAIRLMNGQRVVWVMRNEQPEMVNIELGRTSDINSEVISTNLKEGDLLVLNPPTQRLGSGGLRGGF